MTVNLKFMNLKEYILMMYKVKEKSLFHLKFNLKKYVKASFALI